ncbi:MAG: endolytic transglycosylase MltG [Sulfuricaulis sp.]
MRALKRKPVFVLLAAGVVCAAYLLWAWLHPLSPGTGTYEIKPGMSLRAFAHELSGRDVLSESHSFVLLAYLTGHNRHMRSGEYRFHDGITAWELLDQIVAGRVIEYPVVLVEGWTFRQFLQTIEEAPKLTHTLSGLSPDAIMARLGHPGEAAEGRFFPDTYYYSTGQTDLMIMANAYDKMRKTLEQQWATRAADLPFKDPYEALILASIVEKETGRADERGRIAGVFINRLRLGMRLQSDPTVIYGMGRYYDGNIRLKDLKHDTPYNTYTRSGLPPTPVAMPGKDSLYAVLHPAATDALYFVSRGDGSHVFSATLEEHNQAVIKYQLKGKPRSSVPSPPPRAGARPRARKKISSQE